MVPRSSARGVLVALTLWFGHSGAIAQEASPIKIPDSRLEPIAWSDLDSWADDNHVLAFAAFLNSCKAVVNSKAAKRGTNTMPAALAPICRRAIAAAPLSSETAKTFFEENFRPVRISKLADAEGFLTGYYEPVVHGSRMPSPAFHVPVYRRPPNLVVWGQGTKKVGVFPNKGKRIGRRVGRKKLVPYYDRAEIEDGALDGWHLEICYLKDPIDLFFAQIQGSVRVQLEDGVMLRLNYDAHNGHPYTPVGKLLIDRNLVPKDQMSMDKIREWMEANPDGAKELRRQNRSYIFFRVTDLTDEQEAIGAQGVPLMPGRSIAVDRALHTYGTPFWIEAELPINGNAPTTKFRRLMVAQDTGSAIVGPARADLYFGAGDQAGAIAGRLRHNGRFVMLVPKILDPAQIAADVPLPPEKPKFDGVETAATVVAKAEPEPALLDTPLPPSKPESLPKQATAYQAERPAAPIKILPASKATIMPVPRPRPRPQP